MKGSLLTLTYLCIPWYFFLLAHQAKCIPSTRRIDLVCPDHFLAFFLALGGRGQNVLPRRRYSWFAAHKKIHLR